MNNYFCLRIFIVYTNSRDYEIHIRVHVLHQFAYINHKCFILIRFRIHDIRVHTCLYLQKKQDSLKKKNRFDQTFCFFGMQRMFTIFE